ncbi:OsmC family protein [Ohtaekwangia koreensis]|jgi:lipoyl-dependent peroxiredoxin|uniref:Osmotically inducible protein OsmC n=1 Tax=Ohtaekwangia koreensis TaxID=688867 RepID=A0A1T5IT10_9BACT|nr:OsmC family protein [Ohtaekwangia koreensis]SKC42290.1 osmotically inducible protein OsmC [Ohtaekwangia koreensis]
MKRTASAHWSGDLKAGQGNITTQSTTLNKTQYSFNTRFADGVGTNPEELIGAAHAGCFTMALSAALMQAGFTAGDLDTKATVEFDTNALKITGITLDLVATPIANVSAEQFKTIATAAKENCPISKALASVPITLNVSY